MFFSNSPTCLTILHRNRMKSRRTLHRMKSWLKSPKVGTLPRENRTLFHTFDQFGLWGSLGASGDQSVSLGRLWGARMAQDGAKMVKDGAKPTVRPTDRPSDRPSLRPTVRPPDRLYTLTPDQPLQRPHISSSSSSRSSLRELALAYRRKYRMSCVHVRVGSFGAITRVCEMG